MRQVPGFTLIELIMVIVILGILSVSASFYVSHSVDGAREAVVKETYQQLLKNTEMIYSLAMSQGISQRHESKLILNGEPLALNYGYPSATLSKRDSATGLITQRGVDYLLGAAAPDWRFVSYQGSLTLTPRKLSKNLGNSCTITYIAATSERQASLKLSEPLKCS
ncbi:type II secretion system protein [Dongshaea marina]|uniref:type II secretion system protein n=1 Tax=Dongshaea marina TaxID=2047966 RepID=UPI00131ED77E|nr:type II secretion system protein [Dongshaea marina]